MTVCDGWAKKCVGESDPFRVKPRSASPSRAKAAAASPSRARSAFTAVVDARDASSNESDPVAAAASRRASAPDDALNGGSARGRWVYEAVAISASVRHLSWATRDARLRSRDRAGLGVPSTPDEVLAAHTIDAAEGGGGCDSSS